MKEINRMALIIPVLNEEMTIEATIKDFAINFPELFIYIIDNNSNDKSIELSMEALSRYAPGRGQILYAPLPGKAEAMRKAFREIEADFYIMVDGDNTYRASDLASLLVRISSNRVDMVIGDRFSLGEYQLNIKRPLHYFGNKLLSTLINILFRANLKDLTSGYRIFTREFVKSYPILRSGFEIETEMTLFALNHSFSIIEVPIHYRDRVRGSYSKLKTFSDGIGVLKAIFTIFKDYRPLLFFSLCSLFFLLLALLFGIPVIWEFVETRWVSHVPLAILSTGLSLFSLLFLAIGLILDTVARNYHALCELHRLVQKR